MDRKEYMKAYWQRPEVKERQNKRHRDAYWAKKALEEDDYNDYWDIWNEEE